MGEIGGKIAARVAAFEAEVGYFSRTRRDVPYQYLPSLEALAEWCSVLMIAVRAGEETHHTVDALSSRPPGLGDRGSHALKGKSAEVQVFGLDPSA
jgi:hypothetical protein